MYPYLHLILPTYAVMAFLGFFLSTGFAYLRLDEQEISFSCFLKILCCSLLGVLMGSKMLFALTQIPWLVEHFNFKNAIMLIPQSGYVFYGGLFGAIFLIHILFRNDIKMKRKAFQLIVPVFPLFHTFGRIGCFLTGCCYGKKFEAPLEIGGVVLERVPVQLIEALMELVIFVSILLIQRKKPEADLLKFYLVTYAVVRFGDEFLRGDLIRGIWFGLSTAQWISLVIIVYYIVKKIHSLKFS